MANRFENIENKDGFYVYHTLKDTEAATAANYEVIFNVLRPCQLLEVSEAHRTAGTDGGAVGLNIERLSGTEALDAGDTMLVADFDLKGAADTVSNKRTVDLQNRNLKKGDRIALKDVGTLTSVAGLTVTLYLKPLGKGDYR